MPRRASKDDAALRRSYLEAYAARDARKRLSRINKEVGVNQRTVDAWLRTDEFREEMQKIDRSRLSEALRVANFYFPRAVEYQAAIACGDRLDPPTTEELEDLDPAARVALLHAYTKREEKREQMSTRAAELLKDLVMPKTGELHVHVDGESFNGLPDDVEELAAENERLDKVLKRYRERTGAANGGK